MIRGEMEYSELQNNVHDDFDNQLCRAMQIIDMHKRVFSLTKILDDLSSTAYDFVTSNLVSSDILADHIVEAFGFVHAYHFAYPANVPNYYRLKNFYSKLDLPCWNF